MNLRIKATEKEYEAPLDYFKKNPEIIAYETLANKIKGILSQTLGITKFK